MDGNNYINDNNIHRQIANNYCLLNFNNSNYEAPFKQNIQFNSSSLSKVTLQQRSLGHRYYQLFITEKYSDCSFCIDNERIIKAHKLILSTASPVFEAMLYGPLNINDNCNSTGIKLINITDISFETFYKMLIFIYTDEINLINETLENTMELYYCGEKYLIKELKQNALQAIKEKLRFDNILETLDLAILTNLHSLIKICLHFFEQYCISSDNGATKFMLTIKSSYYHLSKDTLMEILNKTSFGKNCKKYLYWFVKEWIRNDFDYKNQQKLNKNLELNDDMKSKRDEQEQHEQNDENYVEEIENVVSSNLNAIIENEDDWSIMENKNFTGNDYKFEQTIYIERTYYKARQPFLINETNNKFEVSIKSNRYTSLIGLVLHSRLKPNPIPLFDLNNRNQFINYNNYDAYDYKESFKIEIYSINSDNNINNNDGDGDEQQQEQQLLEHSEILNEKSFTYNCDINIILKNKIILIPDEKYIIKFVWDSKNAKGAEYPCSLLSSKVGGIFFEDLTTYGNGSILKGLKLLNPDEEKN